MSTQSQADIQEIVRLKSLYYAAINRKFLGPETQDAPTDNEGQKRAKKALRMAHKATEPENQAFVERLRRRMVELGVTP